MMDCQHTNMRGLVDQRTFNAVKRKNIVVLNVHWSISGSCRCSSTALTLTQNIYTVLDAEITGSWSERSLPSAFLM
eukprot:m.785475 g.785475  ORF g.785475 m.785475 type:complete len:76 (-) comp59166_c0_seq2:4463-4690(-)